MFILNDITFIRVFESEPEHTHAHTSVQRSHVYTEYYFNEETLSRSTQFYYTNLILMLYVTISLHI